MTVSTKTLHDYQKRTAQFIVDNPASFCLLEVGLGKTASTLTAIKSLNDTGDWIQVLVIAPKRVAEHVWSEEVQTWTPDLSISIAAGSPSERKRAIKKGAVITVIGRDNVCWLVKEFKDAWPFNMLVIDESQGFKDASSKRFKSLKKVRQHFDRVVLLSATPATEGLMGLWSQSFMLDGGKRLGRSFTAYKQAFFDADYMGWKFTPAKGAEAEIFKRLSDVSIAMKAEDYLTLPERIDNFVTVEFDHEARKTYDKMEKDYLLPIKNGEPITAVNAAVLWGKLHQIAGGAAYDAEKAVVEFSSVKLDALSEIIESANGAPVLVFYGYKHEVDRIKANIKGAEDIDVARWNAGKQRVALAHAESCGAGLNLQHGGSIAVWYSIPASLGQYIQACGRLHRQGQKKTTIIHHIVVRDTIDETIVQALKDKDLGQRRLIDAIKQRVA